MDYNFVKYFGFGLGLALGLDCFWSRSRPLGLEIWRSQSPSWSLKIIGSGLGLDVCGLA